MLLINPYRFAAARSAVSDADAEVYLQAVEAADGSSLEQSVADAVNDFVVGCKSDGIWSAIKASCILAGARTLSGALVPLVGNAPTNNNFVTADYDRETGLLGNGTTKYLNSNRAQNSDPQNDAHISVYMSQKPGAGIRVPLGIGAPTHSGLVWNFGGNAFFARVNNNTNNMNDQGGATTNGFYGATRSAAASYSYLRAADSSTTSLSINSGTPSSNNHYVMAFNNNNTPSFFSTGRLAFYSIGESVNLTNFRTRVNTLITDLAAAIP